MNSRKWSNPFLLPVYLFALTIFLGAAMLKLPFSVTAEDISWLDAIFTTTSATCVTGLAVVDTGSFFTRTGQGVILVCIQLGGLGIMTYTSLVFYLWKRRITMTDRLAVGQSLLHDPTFHLGSFLQQMVVYTFVIEGSGALLLYIFDPRGFNAFSAVFHAVSAFCNAGFGLHSRNLMPWVENTGVNFVVMALITLGGLGFSVLIELSKTVFRKRNVRETNRRRLKLSFHTRVVLWTSLGLTLGGAILIYIAECVGILKSFSYGNGFMAALFQSVTCRTAGFNTLDIGAMNSPSLMVMIFLMFVGGSPGSCAGGIKTTTFTALLAFGRSQMAGRSQAVIRKLAFDPETMNKTITLTIFAMVLVFFSAFIMTFTECGEAPHSQARFSVLQIFFEVVSAFGTVGLSTGITPDLTPMGKVIIILLMFIGRLGPILFLSILQSHQHRPRYAWPEEAVMIG